MIKITEWTRQASQDREITTHENGDRDIFNISINHSGGQYRAHWEKATIEHRDGYTSRLSYPFADYNGQTIIKTGRFNKKWLEKADNILAANLDKYYALWNAGEYQTLCNEIHADTAAI